MKKHYSKFTPKPARGIAAAIALLALTVGGCVDNNYDLDNISKEVTVGGDEVVIPVGSFDKQLKDLIGTSLSSLNPDGNGGYEFSFKGDSKSFDINIESSEAITVDSKSQETTLKFVAPEEGAAAAEGAHLNINEIKTEIAGEEVELPSDLNIAKADLIYISNGNEAAEDDDYAQYVQATIEFSADKGELTAIPAGEVTLNYEINFGSNLRPAAHKNYTIAKNDDGQYVVTGAEPWSLSTEAEKKITVYLDAIENPTIEDQTLIVSDEIVVNSDIELEEANTAWNGVKVSSTFAVEDIYIAALHGKIGYTADEVETTIKLEDINSSKLEIDNLAISPVISFDIENPAPTAFIVDITFVGLDASGNAIQGATAKVEGVKVNANSASSLTISDYDNADYTASPALSNLFANKIPADIKLTVTMGTDPDEVSTIELNTEYEITYSYSVALPLEFGKGSKFAYITTIKDFTDDIDEIEGVKVQEAVVVANFESTVPFDLTLSATPLGADGAKLPESVLTAEVVEGYNVIHYSDDAANPQESTIYIKLNIPDGDINKIKQMKAVHLSFEADNTDIGASELREDQTLKALLTLHINGGITIDIDKVQNN